MIEISTLTEEEYFGNTEIRSVRLLASVTAVPPVAFAESPSLTSVEFPSGLKEVGTGAFASCVSLARVSLPDSCTYIGEGAFMNCSNLTHLDIPNPKCVIEKGAITSCPCLMEGYVARPMSGLEEACNSVEVGFDAQMHRGHAAHSVDEELLTMVILFLSTLNKHAERSDVDALKVFLAKHAEIVFEAIVGRNAQSALAGFMSPSLLPSEARQGFASRILALGRPSLTRVLFG